MRLALGTVQLGLNYGILNTSGKPDADEARATVKAAWEGGCRHFDTARAYGDSEQVLGQCLRQLGIARDSKVITKVGTGPHQLESYDSELTLSLGNLQCDSVYGLLLHREEALHHWDDWLGPWMREKLHKKVAARIGVSVYNPEFALKALDIPEISILQIAFNVFDRKMLRAEVLKKARERGVDLYIRSVYLQGLALAKPSEIPAHLPFAAAPVSLLDRFCEQHNIERREFVVGYVADHVREGFLLMGAENSRQAGSNCALIKALPSRPTLTALWDQLFPEDDPTLANPATWPMKPERTSRAEA